MRRYYGCGIIRNVYLVFILSSWHKAPKTLEISWVIGNPLVIYSVTLLIIPEFMLMTKMVTRNIKWLEVITFNPPSNPQKVWGNWRLDSIKTLEQWTLYSFWVGEPTEGLGEWHALRGCGSSMPSVPPLTCPVHLSHSAVTKLHPL